MAGMPETRYAKRGDSYIAYQVMGTGPFDLVLVPGFISHVELHMEQPLPAQFFSRVASFCRLIRFDKRGTGLSDRLSGIPTLEERMDDVRAVMDAANSSRAALFGFSEGGPMSILFSATYPERTSALVLYGSTARFAWAPDNPWGRTDEQLAARLKMIEQTWGQGKSLDVWAPSLSGNDELRRLTGRFERAGATPGAAQAIMRMNHEIDVRHILPTVRSPTLVLHRTGDLAVSVEHGRYAAKRIRGAKYVEFPGPDHLPWAGDSNSIIKEVEDFLTENNASEPDSDRILASVLFADIVGSTELAGKLGDRAWMKLLEDHHRIVQQQVDRHRGQVIDTAGDGLFATFDGPARAVRCGQAITGAVKGLGVQMRAGVHTGECEKAGQKLAGIAVHIGARVMSLARPDEVLVSSTVKDLVAGSGLQFESRGAHALKGVEGEWNLFAAH